MFGKQIRTIFSLSEFSQITVICLTTNSGDFVLAVGKPHLLSMDIQYKSATQFGQIAFHLLVSQNLFSVITCNQKPDCG
jgi:hypothetical protein